MQNQPKNIPTSPTLRKAWEELHQVAPKGILNSQKMTRRQRERLTSAGYLEPIMRGWYRLKSPGEQTSTHPPILDFLPIYLEERLGARWCLSAESSLVIHMSPHKHPGRLVVMAEIGSTTVHTFDCGLRLTIYQDDQQLPTRMENLGGFRVMPLDTLLGRMTNTQWNRQKDLVDQALKKVTQWETMVWQWLSEERFQAVTRLGERLEDLGLDKGAKIIRKYLREEGLASPETSEITIPTKSVEPSTENHDLKTIWPIWSINLSAENPPTTPSDSTLLTRLSAIEHSLAEDTQNHLALSGFTIPREVILNLMAEPELAAEAHGWPNLQPNERLTTERQCTPLAGDIDPQTLVTVQGYLEALRLVKRSIVRLMGGQELDRVLRQDVRGWRLALMNPSAEAGMITRRQVLRYRQPESHETDIKKSMENWIELVSQSEPGIQRGVLAFLGILKIKPWASGNQRMALLILNGLNAAAGQPWTVLNQTQNQALKTALHQAMSEGNSRPLAQLLSTHQIT
jgi:hypothetical protein